jgi:alpha-methylacyl-CoA racemase
MERAHMSGPLSGVRVVELGGIGPGPHAGMLLADLGADVVRVERPSGGLQGLPDPSRDPVLRGRRSVLANLRDEADLEGVRALIDRADVVIDGFRPGVTDRLGIGPEELTRRNPRLIYGHMTGWGVSGPLRDRAGHDINYLSITGVLHAIRTQGARPTPPLNLLGDYGGGSLYLLVGILSALHERERSGRGQVIDAAIVDGVTSLAQVVWSMRAQEAWTDEPAANLLDTGAPFYDTYRCAEGGYVAVGALEPAFYAQLLEGLGLDPADLPEQYDREGWPTLRARLSAAFAERPRDAWTEVFDGTDACVTPVLTFEEAREHPHLVARGTVAAVDGDPQASVAPRFSRSVPPPVARAPEPGSSALEGLAREWADRSPGKAGGRVTVGTGPHRTQRGTGDAPAATLELLGHVALLTLNRPEARNAVDAALATAAGEALDEVARDPELRAMVVTGAGRSFCAGADLKEVAAGRDVGPIGHPEWGFAGIVRHFLPIPMICAVNGHARGGGTEIVLASDLAVIDADATLGLPEVTRGLFAAAGGVLRLQRQVPMKLAMEMALTGEPVDAETAHRWGLVNRVAAPGGALAAALDLAERVAANSPMAVRASKDLLQRSASVGSDWDDAVWELNERWLERVLASEDATEGARAFAERRAPVWRGG